MRISRNIFMLCTGSITFFSFTGSNAPVPFRQVLDEKKITMKIIPTGTFEGNSINLQVTNISGGLLNVELPRGTTFVPDDSNEQTLVMPDQQVFVLGKSETKMININAFCTEANDNCPSLQSTFTISNTQNSSLQKLVHYLDSAKVNDIGLIQSGIWCVTDSESVSDISGDEETAGALRKYVCSLTGQKETWYNTKEYITTNEENQIVRVPDEVKGTIEFHSDDDVELQGKIVDATGRVLFQNPNKTHCEAGDITFDFELKVQGWKPGTYAVVYTSSTGKEMLRQEFTI
ncbi:MAG: hypothetical protein HY064_01310 [Bacteroidetes bacterium]|nr:hypothetical protein [Bacteroidota bacterium]